MSSQKNNQIIAIEDRDNLPFKQQNEIGHISDGLGFPDDKEDTLGDLKFLVRILSRYKWLILSITLLFAAKSVMDVMVLTPMYRATTTVKIDTEGAKLAHYDDVIEQKSEGITFHQTQFELLKSRKLARLVIDKLELEQDGIAQGQLEPLYAQLFFKLKQKALDLFKLEKSFETTTSEHLEELFIEHIKLEPVKKSNIVRISYDSHDAKLAASIVNTIADEYIQMNLEGMSETSAYAKQYLKEQIALAKNKLESSEANLVKYAKEKQIINTDNKTSLVSEELEILNRAFAEAKKEFVLIEIEYRKSKKYKTAKTDLDSETISGLKNQVQILEKDYIKQLQVYKPGYPAMIGLKKQINELHRRIKIEVEKVSRLAKNELEARYFAAKEKKQAFSKDLELKKAELLAQRDKSIGYMTLEREVETNRQLYDNLLQRMKEVGVAGGVVSNNISVIDAAYPPKLPIPSEKYLTILKWALSGFLIGFILALIRNRFDDKIRTVDELEGLTELPILGIIPFLKEKSKKDNAFLFKDSQSMEAEAYRSLVTYMNYLDSSGMPQIIHITSASPGEGKSNTAINIASTIAEHNKKVLLVEADLRKPKIGQYMRSSHEHGLSDFIVGRNSMEEITQETDHENFHMITAGSISPSPSKLLADDQMLEFLKIASEDYDHIVIDSPPVIGLADALILANRSNATLFVVSSNETRKAHMLEALKRLRVGYGNVVGFILTKAKSSKNSYYSYNSYYGHRSDHDTRQLNFID